MAQITWPARVPLGIFPLGPALGAEHTRGCCCRQRRHGNFEIKLRSRLHRVQRSHPVMSLFMHLLGLSQGSSTIRRHHRARHSQYRHLIVCLLGAPARLSRGLTAQQETQRAEVDLVGQQRVRSRAVNAGCGAFGLFFDLMAEEKTVVVRWFFLSHVFSLCVYLAFLCAGLLYVHDLLCAWLFCVLNFCACSASVRTRPLCVLLLFVACVCTWPLFVPVLCVFLTFGVCSTCLCARGFCVCLTFVCAWLLCELGFRVCLALICAWHLFVPGPCANLSFVCA